MVLNEASPMAPDTFSDNISDDVDPYASTPESSTSSTSRSRTLPPSIDLKKLARPIPVLGPMSGYSDLKLRRIIELDAAEMSSILQRPLTLPEWDATAFHMAKMHSYSSYGWPIGSAWGLVQASRTMNEWRFPFYKPNLEKIGAERFDRFLSLRGQMARNAWHTVRFSLYMGLSGVWSGLALTFYGMNVAMVGKRVDERLTDFWNTVKTLDRDELRRRMNLESSVPTQQSKAPTDTTTSFEGTDTDNPQDAQTSQARPDAWADRRAAAARGEPPASTGSLGVRQSRSERRPSTSDFDYDFDDGADDKERALNTSSSERPPQRPQQEGAWDRIRRGNAPQPLPNQPTRPLQGAQGDAWSRIRSSSTGEGEEGDDMMGWRS